MQGRYDVMHIIIMTVMDEPSKIAHRNGFLHCLRGESRIRKPICFLHAQEGPAPVEDCDVDDLEGVPQVDLPVLGPNRCGSGTGPGCTASVAVHCQVRGEGARCGGLGCCLASTDQHRGICTPCNTSLTSVLQKAHVKGWLALLQLYLRLHSLQQLDRATCHALPGCLYWSFTMHVVAQSLHISCDMAPAAPWPVWAKTCSSKQTADTRAINQISCDSLACSIQLDTRPLWEPQTLIIQLL